MPLRRCFSNQSAALKSLTSRGLRGKHDLASRPERTSRRDIRGPVVEKTLRTQTSLSAPLRIEVLTTYTAGTPVNEIARQYRVHRNSFSELASDAGLVMRRNQELSATTGAEARRLYESGLTLEEVGQELGASRMGVRTAILKAGGTMRPRGRQPQTRSELVS